MSNEAVVEKSEKAKKHVYRNFLKKGWPFMKLEEAKEKRWANKNDGQPTKIYLHALAKAQAEKNGAVAPKRSRKAAPEQFHAGIQSPYDLRRRSGYKMIWMVLAEKANEFVSHEYLHAEVNKRLATDPTDKNGWYEKNFASEGLEYDTYKNSIVIGRAPYNGVQSDGTVKDISIEGLQQRVVLDSVEGVMLMTEVAEPRNFKKRGRKLKTTNEVVEDNDTSVVIDSEDSSTEAEETVEETVQA